MSGRVTLSDDGGLTSDWGPMVVESDRSIMLDSDVETTFEEMDVMPHVTILGRTVIGRDLNGDRLYGWAAIASDVSAASYVSSHEVVDGVTIVKIKLTVLDPGVVVDSTCAVRVETGDADSPDELPVYRITSAFQNGVRVELEGERSI